MKHKDTGVVAEDVAAESVDVTCDHNKLSWLDEWLETDTEPVTEPETKEETMETKENHNLSQDIANCDKSEDKELNLTQLLIGHEGEKFLESCVLRFKALSHRYGR